MLDTRRHRTKYIDLDIMNLKEEIYNIEKRINHAKQRKHVFHMFDYVSASGHTLMSWAGAVGSGEVSHRTADRPGKERHDCTFQIPYLTGSIMSFFLTHGGSLGWGAEYEECLCTAVATAWRLRKLNKQYIDVGHITIEYRLNHGALQVRALDITQTGTWLRYLSDDALVIFSFLQEKLRMTIRRMKVIRRQRRSPLIEAYYNQNHEVVDRLFREQTSYLAAAAVTYASPLPPPPGAASGLHEKSNQRLNIVDCANLAFARLHACDYVHGHGWLPPSDPKAR